MHTRMSEWITEMNENDDKIATLIQQVNRKHEENTMRYQVWMGSVPASQDGVMINTDIAEVFAYIDALGDYDDEGVQMWMVETEHPEPEGIAEWMEWSEKLDSEKVLLHIAARDCEHLTEIWNAIATVKA